MIYDVVIIGAGVIGGMLSRELSKYELSVCVLEKENEDCPDGQSSFYGRSVGIRTRGLLDPNQARYQTSPHPESQIIIMKF